MSTLTMQNYILWYRDKVRRNGKEWTLESIMEDCGAAPNEVQLFQAWCRLNGADKTDEQLIKEYETNWYVNHTPFGDIIQPVAGTGGTATGGISNFIEDLKALMHRYNIG